LLAVLLIAAGFALFFVLRPSSPLAKPPAAASPALVTGVVEVLPVTGPKAVREFRVTWDGKEYYFSHRCETGTIETTSKGTSGIPLSYCVGKNVLVYIDATGKETVIDTTDAVNPSSVPVLFGASVDAAGAVILSYAVDSCALFGECEGIQPSWVQIRGNLTTGKFKLFP
jgi:hypothetical protein